MNMLFSLLKPFVNLFQHTFLNGLSTQSKHPIFNCVDNVNEPHRTLPSTPHKSLLIKASLLQNRWAKYRKTSSATLFSLAGNYVLDGQLNPPRVAYTHFASL